jgi:uncharacterized protein
MKKSNINRFNILIAGILAVSLFSCTPKPELRALIVTGQNNHNVTNSTAALVSILDKAEIFTVFIRTSPGQGRDMSEFLIDFTPYDVVVLNYTGDAWPEETRNNFVNYVENGGGVVVVHAANNAFPDWKEFNEIIGLGGWGDRDENSGPYVYVKDGEVVRDNSAGHGGNHGPQHEYIIETFQPEHPIMKGLPAKWLHAKDELYQELRGPAINMEILATTFAAEEFNGTERNEPALFTISYGSGRIFHTILGHAGGEDQFFPAMECAGFITTLQRGAEWAATGQVTQRVPDGFPDETESVRWEYFEPMDINIISDKIQEYEIGESTSGFIALKDLIAKNESDKARLDEYHEMILDILDSGSASKEGKKILLLEFSWMATDAYKPVYEKLSSDEDLQNEALFALERLNY